MIVGTAGHVDHGKTSLVKALTGIDTDRLKEEKTRGITIDLGFAYMTGADGEMIGFIDVPGHERLVRTMVAGSAGIDFALLVVAADDGVMPQTREHIDVLNLLGLGRGLIVISKCDRASAERRALVAEEIAAAVQRTELARAPIVFASAATGEGLEAIRAHLWNAAQMRPPPRRDERFRLSIDRVFSMKGVGTIVTGTARSGHVQVNDELTLLPGRQRVRVRSLHTQNKPSESGEAGLRCALALVGPGISTKSAARGSWLCGDMAPLETAPLETTRLDARIVCLDRTRFRPTQWTPVHFHCGASDVSARVTLLMDDASGSDQDSLAQILLVSPLPLRHGDRFVLRDQSAQHTIGGGTIIDPRAPARRRRSPERLARLTALERPEPSDALGRLLDLPPGIEDITMFAEDRGLLPTEIPNVQARLDLVGLATGSEHHYVTTRARWGQIGDAVTTFLQHFHEQNPELPGIPGDRLRTSLTPVLPKPIFAAVRERLLAESRVAVQGHWIHLPGHVAQLSVDDQRLETLMTPLIAQDRFRPPRVRDLSTALALSEVSVRRSCKALVRVGRYVELAHDHFFLRETVAEMAAIAQDLTCSSPTHRFTAADFRDRLNNGRKVAIQILETFDRHGLTRREGDLRSVVKPPDLIFGHATPAAPQDISP